MAGPMKRNIVHNHKRSRHVDPAKPYRSALIRVTGVGPGCYRTLGRFKSLTQARIDARDCLRRLRANASSLDKNRDGAFEVWIYRDPIKGTDPDDDGQPVERIAWTV